MGTSSACVWDTSNVYGMLLVLDRVDGIKTDCNRTGEFCDSTGQYLL